MNIKILLASLLLTVPAFAQETPQASVSVAEIEDCANYAINYSLFVFVAHNTKTEEEFKKFVEDQAAHQQNPKLVTVVRKFGEEAWLERNIPPSIAAMDVFRQCEASLLGREPIVKPKQPDTLTRTREQSWDQENLKKHDSGCPTAVYVAPGGNLVQCDS